ncbi:glycosyltransferase family 9 protein [Orrella daihaiensis]|nr:glycosyltransferase family 9 protein [Orrella daihaiensis]
MSLPCLKALSLTGHPLIVCARAWAEDLVKEYAPQHFIAVSGNFRSDYRSIKNLTAATRHSALGLVLPDSLSSAALFRFAGIKSIGYRDDGRSLLLRWPVKKPDHSIHAAEKWWLLTRQALLTWHIQSPLLAHAHAETPMVTLTTSAQDLDVAQTNLIAHGLTPRNFVLLAPTATGTHHGKVKVWPYFAELARLLRSEGTAVAMCPPPQEREQAKRACPDTTLLDPLSLRQFCALTQLSSLVVCNDSGVSHLAAVADAQQLTLFGVTDPSITAARSAQAERLGTNGCWPDLHEVFAKVRQMLAKSQNIDQ